MQAVFKETTPLILLVMNIIMELDPVIIESKHFCYTALVPCITMETWFIDSLLELHTSRKTNTVRERGKGGREKGREGEREGGRKEGRE